MLAVDNQLPLATRYGRIRAFARLACAVERPECGGAADGAEREVRCQVRGAAGMRRARSAAGYGVDAAFVLFSRGTRSSS
jgi:hypothetical protein